MRTKYYLREYYSELDKLQVVIYQVNFINCDRTANDCALSTQQYSLT